MWSPSLPPVTHEAFTHGFGSPPAFMFLVGALHQHDGSNVDTPLCRPILNSSDKEGHEDSMPMGGEESA